MEQGQSGTPSSGSAGGPGERTFLIDWAGSWQLKVDSGIQSGPDSRAPSVISRRSLQSSHTNQTALESLGDPDEWSAPPSVSPGTSMRLILNLLSTDFTLLRCFESCVEIIISEFF